MPELLRVSWSVQEREEKGCTECLKTKDGESQAAYMESTTLRSGFKIFSGHGGGCFSSLLCFSFLLWSLRNPFQTHGGYPSE